MADKGDSLRIKYGLINNPSLATQERWASLAETLIRQGHSSEVAGRAAAQQVFSDFERMKYASAGDTIEMLLRQIRDK